MPDYEGELAVVISRPGRQIPEQDALDYVAGYTAFIATGTPSGIGAVRTPPRFLRPGDTVVISIDGVTELTNQVVGEGS
jgi:2-keto-4-pentenoate hydratase/2-oxohepta-3-ene-1,7-dioic acid hydratase in catechol pathway